MTGGFYVPAGSRTNHKSYANQLTPEEGSSGRQFAPVHTFPYSAQDLSVYLQRELYACSRVAGPSARWVSADLEHQMTTRKLQDTPSENISSTSSTSAVFRKVDEQIATRHRGEVLSSTSSTSFSKEGVMWACMGARPPGRLEPSPLRETGRRSRREGVESPQSCGFVVYFGVFSEVDGGRQ